LLEATGRLDGLPVRLSENYGMSFNGCYAFGKGFVIEPGEAEDWISVDPRSSDVLFPYLSGEDLNSRPDSSASRWVIDFNDRTEAEASRYLLPFERLREQVKPERARAGAAVRDAPWWLFWRARPALRKAIGGLEEMLVITRHIKTVMPVRVSTAQIPSDATVVFATDSTVDQCVLSSSLHQLWAIKYGSGIRTDPRYTPSDVFETFPRPEPTNRVVEAGGNLDSERREIMRRRNLGLTDLYNRVNDPDCEDDKDIDHMRQIHVEVDGAVIAAYGWDDVSLDHGFHTYRQMERFTVSPTARVEILDRLLEENHRRAGMLDGSELDEQEGLFS
jgi:hypothetical protein